MSRTDPWSYTVFLGKDSQIVEVLKCKDGPGGIYVYTRVERNNDGTFDSYDGNPFSGGVTKKKASLDEVFVDLDEVFTRLFRSLFAIEGVKLHHRQVRSLVRDKRIRMTIEDWRR